ncbi:trafficking protein particle complex subunit 6A isoform X2 [Gopherus flavomarginatus]|uniref:trafficking protein particle complex subunit 6A isoform X2 n=1 Tax=Gopherus flavomarginatus TaxID=286002 RepID=UPI0021CBE991|nr:trafficking protein particle complex subunit 6A isoform X2 [Gopherus flavomarginatus]
MADSPLFQALHMEMAHALCGEGEQEKGLGALEGVGFRVGQGLSERLTKEMPSFKDELDVLKFLCKDLWITVFKKQVDNLRTNHQGTYMLQDNQFLLLSQLSNGKQYLEEAPKGKYCCSRRPPGGELTGFLPSL